MHSWPKVPFLAQSVPSGNLFVQGYYEESEIESSTVHTFDSAKSKVLCGSLCLMEGPDNCHGFQRDSDDKRCTLVKLVQGATPNDGGDKMVHAIRGGATNQGVVGGSIAERETKVIQSVNFFSAGPPVEATCTDVAPDPKLCSNNDAAVIPMSELPESMTCHNNEDHCHALCQGNTITVRTNEELNITITFEEYVILKFGQGVTNSTYLCERGLAKK